MGTLGQYLRDARVSLGLDLREAAQQTRISAQYLKALEEEDFAKVPGEVFVRGFIKSYGKFLRLDEAELMKRYGELRQKPSPSGAAVHAETPAATAGRPWFGKIPLEPFLWGAGIVVILVLFLIVSLPEQKPKQEGGKATPPAVVTEPSSTSAALTVQPEKLYLEVSALEDTWLLIRTDAAPQKKALLKKGERLIWSADERFSLSYGSAGAVRLLLNGQELTVNEPRNAVIRDMIITASGIVDRTIKPAAPPQPKGRQSAEPQAPQPSETPAREQQRTIAPRTQAPVEKPHDLPGDTPQQPAQ